MPTRQGADAAQSDGVTSNKQWTEAESNASFDMLGDSLIDVTRRFMRSERRERIQSTLYTVDGYELSRAQIEALEVVAQEGEVRMNQLAERLRLDPSTVTRTVNPLVELGLAERFTDPTNRRYVVLRCTKNGQRTVKRVARERHKVMRETLTPMEPSRRLLLVELFDEYTTLLETCRAATENEGSEKDSPAAS